MAQVVDSGEEVAGMFLEGYGGCSMGWATSTPVP